MSWTRHVKHPSKVVAIGDTVEAVVLNVDKDHEKISLGLKQLEPDPWKALENKYPPGTRLKGKVRNLTNFGAFVEIEDGIDGLVHISDMSWAKRVRHPSEIIKKGDEVEVVVLEIDSNKKRISLGMKQTKENPWTSLADEFSIGIETQGLITRLLDRGAVVELRHDVEGFVPQSHLGIENLKKPTDYFDAGVEVPLKVIKMDPQNKRIVLSITAYLEDKGDEAIQEFKDRFPMKEIVEETPVETSAPESSDTSPEQPEVSEEKAEVSPAPKSTEETVETEPAEDIVEPEPAEETVKPESETEKAETTEDSAEPEPVSEEEKKED